MKLKGNKARTIHIPPPLMLALYQYKSWGRGPKRAKKYLEKYGVETPLLFINRYGDGYAETNMNSVINDALDKINRIVVKGGINEKIQLELNETENLDNLLNFKCTPHDLRRTYATWTLLAREKELGSMSKAADYVKNRLGHSSIKTTWKYVDFLESIENHSMLQYQAELTEMIRIG